MTEHRSPVDQAIDLFVYAPLGFALDAKSLLPKLIDRGRDQVNNQVTMARMMGQFAVQQGQAEATKRLGKVQEQATATLSGLGLLPDEPSVPEAPERPSADALATAAAPTVSVPTEKPARKAVGRQSPAALSIPDYDSLAASQVIPRLAGLSAAELEAVQTYESVNRGRKTILSKITQLQG